MKYLFIDTNIFLHFQWCKDLPWEEFIGSNEYRIVVAPIIISELDRHKNHQSKKINQRAKRIITQLEKIVDSPADGEIILIQTDRPADGVFDRNRLSTNDPDDCLLASIVSYVPNVPGESILITNDLGVKVKSKSLGINCIRVGDEHRLPEELDETEKQLVNTQKELERLKNRMPKVTLRFKNDSSRYVLRKREIPFPHDKYVQRGIDRIRQQFPPLEKGSEANYDPKTLGFKIPMFHTPSDSQIKDYNENLHTFYWEYREYLQNKYEYVSFLCSSFEVELVLHNKGTAPAENIDVHLHFPDGFVLDDKSSKKRPAEPRPPYKPKNQFDFPSLNLNPFIFHDNLNLSEPESRPYITRLERTNSYDVEFAVGDVKHHQNASLPKLFGCFESHEEMASFTIDYTITIANLPDKIEGQLHFIIE